MTQKRDYIRNLMVSLKEVFRQDHDIARGFYKVKAKTPEPCAPHSYREGKDADGIFWKCHCGLLLDTSKH